FQLHQISSVDGKIPPTYFLATTNNPPVIIILGEDLQSAVAIQDVGEISNTNEFLFKEFGFAKKIQ
ncbi:MAG: hypothetical protein ACK4F9_07900, partial [Brevinematia bacterium]